MTSVNEIRSAFLDFFRAASHEVVPSSPLVPRNDPTLMFTSAGMVQFKNLFTGVEKRPYSRATTAQKCLRAGGKHNDLDNVGYTARHHTFFEMLGNFSFGDYFKPLTAIENWPGTLVTQRIRRSTRTGLLVTVYYDDDEAFDLWKQDRRPCPKAGSSVSPHRTIFGQRARPVPAAPAPRFSTTRATTVFGGPPGSRRRRRRPLSGILEPGLHAIRPARPRANAWRLPRPSIDTGMGLERMAAILQGVTSNYATDLMRTHHPGSREPRPGVDPDGPQAASHRIIADHLRASSLPGSRRRRSVQRRPRLCAAPHHAARHAPHPDCSVRVEPLMWKPRADAGRS